MKAVLAQLDAWLAAHRPAYRAHLRPPAAPAELEAVRARLYVASLGDVKALYEWHDGQELRFTKSLWHNYEWLALSRVHETLFAMEELEDARTPGTWVGWFPFLDNGGGDSVCVDLQGSASHGVGAVLDVPGDFSLKAKLLAPSLEAWLEDLVVGLESGTFRDYED